MDTVADDERLERFVWEHFEYARRNGAEWSVRCPAHEDRSPSLSIGLGEDGRFLLHCFVGCSPESIVKAVGLTMRDLFPPGSRGRPRPVEPPMTPWDEAMMELSERFRLGWRRGDWPPIEHLLDRMMQEQRRAERWGGAA